MTAPDDLARGTEGDDLDLIAHLRILRDMGMGANLTAAEVVAVLDLASVVSRRDADLRTRIEALHREVKRLATNLAVESNWGGLSSTDYDEFLAAIDFAFIEARALDGDTREGAR